MNDFALYWTEKGTRQNIGYRNIEGSVALKYMIHDHENDSIIKGQCCKAVSKVLFFEKPPNSVKGLNSKKLEIDERFKNYLLTKLQKSQL